jgi:hypothetical protein
MTTIRAGLAGLLLLWAMPALAQDRDYCPERPGLNTPPCIVDRGHVSVETSLADWTLDDQVDSRTDTVLIGNTVVRVGVTDRVEARVGWTPFGHERMRDKSDGSIGSRDRAGDVTLGLKAGLLHPDGQGLSIALLPEVSLPIGRRPVGAGTWAAGLLLPVSWSVTDAVQLEATPEVDAAANESGDGRHLAYSGTAGIGVAIAKPLTLTAELQVQRDEDPDQGTTPVLAALSLGWKAQKNLQFDVFGAAGLNRDAPDVELYAGVARRF